MQIIKAEGDVLHYRRTGPTQIADIIVNRSPRLIVAEAFGKHTEVNPYGFTILVEDVPPPPASTLEEKTLEQPGHTPPARPEEPTVQKAEEPAKAETEPKTEKAPKAEPAREPEIREPTPRP